MPDFALSHFFIPRDRTSAPEAAPHTPADPRPVGDAFIAFSPAMREVRQQIERLAAIDASVLLLGESGTGKEAAARMIHALSHRSAHPFVRLNCSGSQSELLQSELFGHEPGALAGAREARMGKLETAAHGTLLLDDIAGMPTAAQASLLHFLESGEFSRLGGATTLCADVRVLAAASSQLRSAVRPALRPDLYYRLNVFTLSLPPLRERGEDIPHLLNHFLDVWSPAFGRPRLPVTRRILDRCAAYGWPGNLHELESFVKRYLVLGDEDQALDQLLDPMLNQANNAAPQDAAAQMSAPDPVCDLKSIVRGLKREAEREAIVAALERTGGNKLEAAHLLHISLRALHYKVRAYRIHSRHARPKAPAETQELFELPRAVGESIPYERPRGNGGKLIPMSRIAPSVR